MSEVTEQPAAPESTAATAAPAPETPAKDLSLFGSADASEETGGGTDSPEGAEAAVAELTAEELEEIEYEGKKAKVPKEFKDAFLRQQDYTRKTQETAEERRQIAAERAAYQQTAQMREATFVENARILANNDRIQNLQQEVARSGGWDAITQADPVQSMRLERQMRNWQGENQALAQSITQKQQQMAFGEQQETAKRIEEGRQQLAREIPGWSPQLQQQIAEAGTKYYRYKPEELANVSDPRAVMVLHDARQWREHVAKQAVKPAPAPLPKPVSKVSGGGATNAKALSDLNTEEWAVKRRERQSQPRRF